MTMPEAVDAILKLAAAEEGQLSRCVYNVSSFSATAQEIADLVREYFPGALLLLSLIGNIHLQTDCLRERTIARAVNSEVHDR